MNHTSTSRSRRRFSAAGFTLLEVLVATLVMGIAVAGILSGLAGASRNASRLTGYDRATILAKSKMDELLVERGAPRHVPFGGPFDPAAAHCEECGWQAIVTPFEAVPGAGPGAQAVDRIQLEIWWMEGGVRRSFTLEGFRRNVLHPEDVGTL